MQTSDPSNFFRTETALALENARRLKSERTRDLGLPINVAGKPLDILVKSGQVWCAESDFVARRIDLESGATVQVYKGHTGPVTTLDMLDGSPDSKEPSVLVTGSWDTTIKLWNTNDKSLISSTPAHSDFVKSVLVVPQLKMLISGGADKTVRFWDLSDPWVKTSLPSLGFLSSHTRPVQCLAVDVHSTGAATLFTADSMGVVKIWDLERQYGDVPHCRGIQREERASHRTAINDMWYGDGELWTASSDDTVLLQYYPPPTDSVRSLPSFSHTKAVKAILPLSLTEIAEPYVITAYGELIRVYDVSSPEEPEVMNEVDAHWHDVTALRLWRRTIRGEDGTQTVEPWIISSSLDGTIRKWRLCDLLSPSKVVQDVPVIEEQQKFQMTDDEERELAELMNSD